MFACDLINMYIKSVYCLVIKLNDASIYVTQEYKGLLDFFFSDAEKHFLLIFLLIPEC